MGVDVENTYRAAFTVVGRNHHFRPGPVVAGDVARKRMDIVHDLGLKDSVGFTGWVAPEDFPQLPAAADLGVVLRSPSAGETSAAALRFLACGTPVAVSALHQFLELPEAAAPRVTPGPSATAELARIVFRAHSDRGEWESRRAAARRVYMADHTPEVAADQLVAALAKMVR